MTAKQYKILLDFYNEFPGEFNNLSESTTTWFYHILHGRALYNHNNATYELKGNQS